MKKIGIYWKKILVVNITNFVVLGVFILYTLFTDNRGWMSNLISVFHFIFLVSLVSSFFISRYCFNFKDKIIHNLFTPLSLVLTTFITLLSLGEQPFLDSLFMILFISVVAYTGMFVGLIVEQIFLCIKKYRQNQKTNKK